MGPWSSPRSQRVPPARTSRSARFSFPRPLRPHIRALYCYARLVDELGDAYEGDRLAALDELEREVDAAFAGEATWPVLRNVQPTIREFDLPREPFLRLIEANRMDQRVSEYETWADVKHYCVHSADPCGRLVLGVLRRLDDPELVAASDSVCTGLQLVNFLQDVPRDLELGRIYLPGGGPARVRRSAARPADGRPARAAAVRGRSAPRSCSPPARCCARGSAGGSAAPSRSSPAAAWPRSTRSSRRAGTSSARARGRRAPGSRARPRSSSSDERPVEEAYAEVERITRREAKNFAYGIMVLPREKRQAIAAIYAFARRVDDVADGELPPEEKRAGSRSFAAALDARSRRSGLRRAARRARALRHPARAARGARRRRAAGHRAVHATPTSPSCAATARRSPARSGSPASRSTAPTTPSTR